jgi:hypothetical protein
MNETNDYAIAKALNNEVLSIILCVVMADAIGLPEDHEISELNRAYVLLLNELEKLYSRNSKLADIKPEPIWKKFEVLKTSAWAINEYLSNPDNDMGQAHIARLDRLCIIAGKEIPELNPEQETLIANSSAAVKTYMQILERARLDNNAQIEDSWYIPEYKLSYMNDGTILVNGVLKLKKTHIDSTIDRLLEQAFKHPNELFLPELGRTSRNLSTVLSSAGFTPTLRQLFFPVISKSKGVRFRPVVSHILASKENVDTSTLDLLLRTLDADVTFSE